MLSLYLGLGSFKTQTEWSRSCSGCGAIGDNFLIQSVDTVIYEDKLYRNTNIRTLNNGHLANIDDEDTLVDIEFVQFADIKIELKTLEDE